MRCRVAALIALPVLLAAGCGPQASDEPPTQDEPTPAPERDDADPGDADREAADPGDADPEGSAPGDTDEVDVTVEVVADGLEAPWDVAFLDDRAFVTERDRGRLLELGDGGSPREVRTFEVDPAGEGGLLGLVAAPDGNELFVYLTTAEDNRIVRFDPDGGDDDGEVVLDGIPKGTVHNGGRLAFGPDGRLYVGTGDAGDPAFAADESSLGGKVLRIEPDGEVPDDNPIDGSPVFSLGHRNVQGLAFDADGHLFASEFGPDVDDEINLIEPGLDYGWPAVTGEAGVDGYEDPVLVRQPAEASWSGGTFLVDSAIPQWDGDLLIASLRGQRVWRITLDDGEVSQTEPLLEGEHGRLRDALQAPDGSVWVLTNNRDGRGSPSDDDDRILRLGPR